MTVNKLQLPAKENAVQLKINEIIDNLGGGTATDVQINGTSITSNDVANIITNSAYNATSNKIATMAEINLKQDVSNLVTSVSSSSTDSQYPSAKLFYDINLGKEDKLRTVNVLSTSGTIALADNSVNSIIPTGAVTFSLPSISDNTKFHQILVQVKLTSVYTLNLGTSYYFNKTIPDVSSAGIYNLIWEYDKANSYWVVGCIPKGAE